MLRVKHIIVVGHYGCGGVKAALNDLRLGLVDNWLRHIQDVRQKHAAMLAGCASGEERFDRLCEFNVVEQALNVCHTTVLREAWNRGQDVTVHGWVYRLADGIVRDTGFSVASLDEIAASYTAAIARIGAGNGATPAT